MRGGTKVSPPTGMTLSEFKAEITAQFVHSETTVEAIYYALRSKRNIILHGPGGHAKSDIAEACLKLITPNFYEETYIASCSQQMDASPFVGYTDIKTLREEGIRKTVLTDTVFLKSRYAILEEGFDAPDDLLLSLKDSLQRGYICINGVCEPNKLQTLIICTNVDPMKWASKDQSRNALLGRFAFIHKVEWPSYTANDFQAMFQARGKYDLQVARLAEKCHQLGFPVSPRDVMMMLDIHTMGGLQALQTFRGMTPTIFAELKKLEASFPYIAEIEEIEKALITAEQSTSVEQHLKALANAQRLIKSLKTIPTDGVYSGKLKGLVKKVQEMQQAAIDNLSRPKL